MARKPAPTQAPKGSNTIQPTTDRTVPPTVAQIAALRSLEGYRGNVPMTGFLGWSFLIVLGALAIGLLLSQALVSQRQQQLVADTAARVALQGESRAALISEWLRAMEAQTDAIAKAQLVRLYVAEMAGNGADATMGEALRAQAPYMQQLMREFVQRHKAVGAHLVGPNGQPIISEGALPPAMAENPTVLADVVASAKGVLLPLRLDAHAGVVMDVVRPIFQPSQEGEDTPVTGVLWLSVPVGDKLSALASPTAQDQTGERTAILQSVGGMATVVGATSLAPLNMELESLIGKAHQGRSITLSVVDATRTFASYLPVPHSPFWVLQEFRAADALAAMKLYKPGLYAITGLATAVLAFLMLALTLHLMGQRNATRVKLLGQTMDALVRMVEARDPYLAGHHAKLARVVLQMSNKLNLPVAERATLFYAAQLSAVGRLLVPRQLISKKGKLTLAERQELQKHIEAAQTILGELDFDLPVVPVISQMYERMDGSGYPLGLKGENIHRMARVLGAADAFIAMTSARVHRDALPPEQALQNMRESKHFDKQIIAVLPQS